MANKLVLCNRSHLIVLCESPTCLNYLSIGFDDFVPDPWTCPGCEDDQHDQQIEELSHVHTPGKELTHER